MTSDSDPWMEAWHKLEAFIASGASKEQITEYARELGRALPDARDPVAYAKQAEAVQQVIQEILSLRSPQGSVPGSSGTR